jgi:hypothetical protein
MRRTQGAGGLHSNPRPPMACRVGITWLVAPDHYLTGSWRWLAGLGLRLVRHGAAQPVRKRDRRACAAASSCSPSVGVPLDQAPVGAGSCNLLAALRLCPPAPAARSSASNNAAAAKGEHEKRESSAGRLVSGAACAATRLTSRLVDLLRTSGRVPHRGGHAWVREAPQLLTGIASNAIIQQRAPGWQRRPSAGAHCAPCID